MTHDGTEPRSIEGVLGLGAPPDPDRLAVLAARAASALALLDTQASGAWARMAPGEARATPLKEAMRAYLAGEDDADGLDRGCAETEALMVSLLAGMSRVAPVAWGHVARLEPGRVEGLSKAEKKPWQSAEYVCWQKYKELMGELDAASFEDEMLEAIGKYVRQLMEKRRRAIAAAATDPGGDEERAT